MLELFLIMMVLGASTNPRISIRETSANWKKTEREIDR